MNRWKRMISAAAALLLPFGSLTGFAAQTALPELAMEVQCPEGWAVLTRSIEEDDPILPHLGVGRDEVMGLFQSSGIYLNAVDMETYSEIVVTMVDNSTSQRIFDLSLLTEQELREMADGLLGANLSETTDMDGVHYDSYTMVEHPQAVFLEYRGGIDNDTQNTAILQDFTIINGRHINVTLRDYSGVITAQEEEQFRQMVAGIRFTQIEEKPAAVFWSLPAVLSAAVAALLIAAAFAAGVFLRRKKKMERLGAAAASARQGSGEEERERQ